MQKLQRPKQGYKPFRLNEHSNIVFSLIPDSWQIVTVGSISERITKGTTPSTEGYGYVREGIPFYRVENIDKLGNIDLTNCNHISQDVHDKLLRSHLKEGDILFSLAGTLGRVGIVSKRQSPANVNQALGIIRIIDREYDRTFLQYFLRSSVLERQINIEKTISAQPNVSLTQLSNFKIVKPPLKEQQKIGYILSNVDELIQKTDQIIEQTQRLKKGMMLKLLTKGIGNRRYKSVRFGPFFLNYDIPDKWQVLTLKQCVRSDTPITYGIVQAGPHVPDGTPYIRTGDMSGGRLSKNTMLCTSNEIASSFRRSQVKAGEIVCALRGIVGTVLEVPEELDGANLTQGTARISPRHDIDKRYLLWSLRSEYAKRQFEIFSKGTTLNEITLEQLRIIKVAIPLDLNEQKNLAHILDHLELAIGLHQRFKEKVVTLKEGLMQNLFTGKIRVQA